LFTKTDSPVCPNCEPDEAADYEKVQQTLEETPNQTADQIAEKSGVARDCVLRLVEQGRIRNVAPDEQVKCGMCGGPAISYTKRLCEACLQKLNLELAQQQAKMKLAQKKDASLGLSKAVRNIVAKKRDKAH
jgi:hypothetical protein